jgi:hypothetical protein
VNLIGRLIRPVLDAGEHASDPRAITADLGTVALNFVEHVIAFNISYPIATMVLLDDRHQILCARKG